jgi:hypothetical protein
MATTEERKQRDIRKAFIDERRGELRDQISLAQAETANLAEQWEEIIDEEHDELTAEQDPDLVKLMDVSNGTWISFTKDAATLIYFDHPDGMYSYCLNINGVVAHVSLGSMVYEYPGLDLDSPPRPDPTPGQFRTSPLLHNP